MINVWDLVQWIPYYMDCLVSIAIIYISMISRQAYLSFCGYFNEMWYTFITNIYWKFIWDQTFFQLYGAAYGSIFTDSTCKKILYHAARFIAQCIRKFMLHSSYMQYLHINKVPPFSPFKDFFPNWKGLLVEHNFA